jgi:hypothetical protein
LAHERSWLSPYNYCQWNPIGRIDPTGALDGWVEDDQGTVFWDPNTNSQEEFNTNYAGKQGYQYVSDSDNSKSYTLPSGDGKLIMDSWIGTEDIPNGVGLGSVYIDLSFVPTNTLAEVGWIQTISTNTMVDHINVDEVLPTSNSVVEYLDGGGLGGGITDPSLSEYFDKNPSTGRPISRLNDGPLRRKLEDAQYDVSFHAQSTVLVDRNRTVSVGWGFTVNSATRQTVQTPTILKSTTEFHNQAVNSLIRKY